MASRGFTLIELLVTLAVASILAVLAVPAWSTFWADQQLSADVNTATSALALARSEAITQRRNVEVTFFPPNKDSQRRPEGCRADETLVKDTNKKRYTYPAWCYRVVADAEPLRIGQLKHLSKPDEKFSLTFEPLGTADIGDCPPEDSNVCRLEFIPDGPEHDSVEPVTLRINVTGSIRREAP